MVAGANKMSIETQDSKLDTRHIPAIDSNKIEDSIDEFEVFLMGMDRAHLGLKAFNLPEPERGNLSVTEFQQRQKEHREAKRTHENREAKAYATLYKACSVDENVTLVRNNYTRKCKKDEVEVNAKDLLTLLVDRFKVTGKFQLKDAKKDFDTFKVKTNEDLEAAIARHTGVILVLQELNEEPSDEAKTLSLTSALKNGEERLKLVRNLIAMDETIDYHRLKLKIKSWQMSEKEDEKDDLTSASVNHLDGVPKCTFCGILGHTEDQPCPKKVKNMAWHAKNNSRNKGGKKGGGGRGQYSGGKGSGGRGGGKGKGKWTPYQRDPEKKEKDKRQWEDNSGSSSTYSGCFVCGSKDHRVAECPDKHEQRPSKVSKWANMIVRSEVATLEVNMTMTNPEELIFLDTCCSDEMVILTEKSSRVLEQSKAVKGFEIGLTEKNKSMLVTEIGQKGDWDNILVCPGARRNICGVSRLVKYGYGVWSMDKTVIIDMKAGMQVAECKMLQGMPYLPLHDLLALPDVQAAHKGDLRRPQPSAKSTMEVSNAVFTYPRQLSLDEDGKVCGVHYDEQKAELSEVKMENQKAAHEFI